MAEQKEEIQDGATNIFGMEYGERISMVAIKMTVGTLSMIGSCLLIYNAVVKLRLGHSPTYHRLLLGMSVIDVLHSFVSGSLARHAASAT